MMLEILILLAIAFPVIAIVGLIMAINTRERLRSLEFNVQRLERGLATASAAAAPQAPSVEPAPEAPVIRDIPVIPEPAPTALPLAPVEQPQQAAPAAVAPTAPPPPTAPAPAPSGPSLEERFGTQWTVWVGGVAIALGGFFLVRLSIEQGWFGPGARVFLGALLAIALIVAGEWTRRADILSGVRGLPTAHIPSILTAAGTAVAYADVWAAYGLYDFIGPAVAFVLLGAVALATLAAALLHGPALAGLGLVGAYVTPVIVSSNQPNYWALYLYLGVVTAAAFLLARIRLWRWLAVTAIIFGVLWTLPGIADNRVDWITPHDFHVVGGFVLVALLIVSGFLFGPDAAPGRIDAVSSAGLAAYLLGSTCIVLASGHAPLALATFAALTATTVAVSWRAESATAAVPAAAALTLLVFIDWTLTLNTATLVAPSLETAPTVPEPAYVDYTWNLVVGAFFAALFAIPGFLAQGRSERPIGPMLWSASAVFTPIAILIALYYRIAGFDRSIPFAGVALLLAVLFAYATEALSKREPRPGMAASEAIFATGTVAALALALTMTLEKGWLTIGLALMVPGIAWVSEKRPLPALRWLAAAILVLVLGRIAWQPLIVGSNVGTTPIFNWLLYGYGIPAAAFWLAGHLLRRRADDVPGRMADSAALLFAVLLAFLEIRHYMTGGNVYRNSSGLAEVALQVSVGLAMVIGLERLRQYTHSAVHNVGAIIIAALTLAGIVLGLLLANNPLFTAEPVGGRFINLILLGYALPAAMTAAHALQTRNSRPKGYSAVAAVVAVVLALSYLSLEVRTLYHGPVVADGATSNAEQYTYSAVWLAFGVMLLAIGAFLRSQPVRIASAAVVGLTVFKVFLIDMHDLTGIYQALSFIGLGAVLLGIGRFYQRLLFPRQPPPTTQPT
jgi:uncharacterized membrane protein